MQLFLYPEYDTTIFNNRDYLLKNSGIDEILEVEKTIENVTLRKSITRALLKFDVSSIINQLNSGELVNPKFYLNLKVAQSIQVPKEYSIVAFPVSGSWSAGTGYKYDGNRIANGANWKYRFGSHGEWYSSISRLTYDGGGSWYTNKYTEQSSSFNVSDIIENQDVIVVSPTPTPTPTISDSPTPTPTQTPTQTPYPSYNPTPTPTRTPTPTPTPTISTSNTPTPTVSTTNTPTPTPTPTISESQTPTPTPSISDSATPTPTISESVTPTPSISDSPTPTPSISESPTPTPTISESVTPTPTISDSVTPTPTISESPTPTPSISESPTPTISESPTPTPTPSISDSATPTPTISESPTPTPSISDSATPTPTISESPTPTPTISDSSTPTPTPSISESPTPTPTISYSPTPTPSLSQWNLAGIDTVNYGGIQTFNDVSGDVRMDITNMVYAWITGMIENHGIIVMHASETDDIDYGKLRFFAKETNTTYSPYIEVATTYTRYDIGKYNIIDDSNIVVSATNAHKKYSRNSNIRVTLSARNKFQRKLYTDNVMKFDGDFVLPRDSYYSILDANSNEVIVPYSECSRVACDPIIGNYIDIHNSIMKVGRCYKIMIKTNSTTHDVNAILEVV